MKKGFNPYSEFLVQHFGERVHKIPVDGGMTCPNRDGTVAQGGCIYCDSGSFYKEKIGENNTVREQVLVGISDFKKNSTRRVDKFIVYFQAYSGTYGDTEWLRKKFEEALSVPGVVGLSIATRPDCLNSEVLNLLEEISQRTYLLVELGIQTIHDKTLHFLNRGHDFKTTVDAIQKLRQKGLRNCAHVILYLPGETREDMLETIKVLSNEGVEGFKFHHLHVLKDTALHKHYLDTGEHLPTLEEYVSSACDLLEHIPESISIHRLAGNAPRSRLVAPQWGASKLRIMNAIINELKNRGTCQGFYS